MSKFLEIPKSALTPTCLHKEAKSYILEELRSSLAPFGGQRHGKEEELIQLSIDNSDHKLRMYGSAEELLENINIYKDFPANHNFFKTSAEPYQTHPRIFRGLNNEKYIAKADLFVILQNMMHYLKDGCMPESLRMISMYLKAREQNIDLCAKFVKFEEKFIVEMWKKMEKASPNKMSEIEWARILDEFYILSKTDVLEKFKRLIPLDDDQTKYIPYYGSYNITAAFYSDCDIRIKILKAVIDQYPDLFLARSQEPITVRIFEDGDQKFLMKSEVFKPDPEIPFILETITLEELLKNHDSHTQNVEFIRYPITRAKHRATPIQTPSGGFCILAIDYFFENLRELIFGKKVFQKLKSADVPQFLKNAFGEFSYATENPYFIEVNKPLLLDNQHNLNVPARDVRNAKKDGFTIQNLKNELAHLGLTTTFPEIQNYAEVVYAEVDKRKKGSVLRTCDLFDAVEQCQLICVLERLPEFKKFVHNQRGCHRVYGLKCEYCATENPENQEDQKLSILEKELADLKIAYQKILEENQQKSLEIQDLQQKNLRLSVKNETNEVKMKQLTEKLAESNLSIDYGTACTSNASQQKIQCLICEKSIESGEDQIIRCPLCKRRFHSKCAINWLKEHKECPACNEDLPKF
ncbi:hypothetical protein B9Z55_004358 [Caenorhabditis nigoni]|uniref:RING-type domain-containing protein n=1 Tax=Caenorhabditis nigoni TaxID=1611254 RepID=A0A2G5UWH2_9PELO|nr:hypothetical protein B9Z55_004358 [Caenorhabditis nigoni]